jgi:hypothetical protein
VLVGGLGGFSLFHFVYRVIVIVIDVRHVTL